MIFVIRNGLTRLRRRHQPHLFNANTRTNDAQTHHLQQFLPNGILATPTCEIFGERFSGSLCSGSPIGYVVLPPPRADTPFVHSQVFHWYQPS